MKCTKHRTFSDKTRFAYIYFYAMWNCEAPLFHIPLHIRIGCGNSSFLSWIKIETCISQWTKLQDEKWKKISWLKKKENIKQYERINARPHITFANKIANCSWNIVSSLLLNAIFPIRNVSDAIVANIANVNDKILWLLGGKKMENETEKQINGAERDGTTMTVCSVVRLFLDCTALP